MNEAIYGLNEDDMRELEKQILEQDMRKQADRSAANRYRIQLEMSHNEKEPNSKNTIFSYFPNSLSLFNICKRYFPFEARKNHFEEQLLEAALPYAYIASEINAVRSQYQDKRSLAYLGYSSKAVGHDRTAFQLTLDFATWLQELKEGDVKQMELRRNFSKKSVIEETEFYFFESLCRGVNDALFEGYLLNMQAEKKTHVDHDAVESIKTGIKELVTNLFRKKTLTEVDQPSVILNKSAIQAKVKKGEKKKSKAVIEKKKSNPFPTFESLFVNSDCIHFCVDALRKMDPQVIDEQNNFLLGERKKHFVGAWLKAVMDSQFLKTRNERIVVPHLNTFIKGLKLYEDGNAFRKKSNDFTSHYNSFKKLLKKTSPD